MILLQNLRTNQTHRLKVLFAPKAVSNPYQYILAKSLKRFGIDVEIRTNLPSLFHLLRHRRQIRIIHLHWLSGFYNNRLYYLRFIKFSLKILIARFLGHKIVWTVHNISPHQSINSFVDFVSRYLMILFAHAIIVHCDYAKLYLSKHFQRKRRVFLIPHGNYIGIYENSITRSQARNFFKIDNSKFVYLCFGKLLPYKRVDYLIETFVSMDDKDSILLIAGQCTDHEKRRLTQICRNNNQIRLDYGFIPEDKAQFYFKAANVLVIPFSEILTSGSVILGLSFGLPIIAPNQGCLTEMIDSRKGILYLNKDPHGLLHAMQSIRKMNLEEMGYAACNYAKTLDWHKIGCATSSVYSQIL